MVVTDQERWVSFRALVQQGDGNGKQRMFIGHPHPPRSYLHWPLPGISTSSRGNQEVEELRGHPTMKATPNLPPVRNLDLPSSA